MEVVMSTIEEGFTCPVCDDGLLEYPPPENCCCHISPPCSACTGRVLTCGACGEEFPDKEPEPTKPSSALAHQYDYSYRFRQLPEALLNTAETDFLYEVDRYNYFFGIDGFQDNFGNLFFVTRKNPNKVNWKSAPHSSCTMLKVGWAPPWISREEIRKEVNGTFGGRFLSLSSKNYFEFLAYTD